MTQLGETAHAPSETHHAHGDDDHAVVLLDHLIDHGPTTRTGLATATGLGRAAVAGLSARLAEAGVLRIESADAAGDGRPGRIALTAADHVLVVALLGIDDAVATISTLAGHELARFTEPLAAPPADGADADRGGRSAAASALDSLAVVIDRALAQADRVGRPVADVTVIVDGAVAGAPELAVADERLGLEPLDVVGALGSRSPRLTEAALPSPITLQPASVVAALAEAAAMPGIDDLLVVSGDTQVAAAVIARGAPLRGAHGLAGLLGHLPIVPNGVRCTCGQRGCLVTVAGPDVVLARAGLVAFAAANGRSAALGELVVRVEESDDRARWSWLDAALWIGRTLQVVVPAIDPAVVVVRGYWGSLAGDIETAFRDNRPSFGGGAFAAIPTVTAGRTGPDGPIAGARRQARARLVATPSLLALVDEEHR